MQGLFLLCPPRDYRGGLGEIDLIRPVDGSGRLVGKGFSAIAMYRRIPAGLTLDLMAKENRAIA